MCTHHVHPDAARAHALARARAHSGSRQHANPVHVQLTSTPVASSLMLLVRMSHVFIYRGRAGRGRPLPVRLYLPAGYRAR